MRFLFVVGNSGFGRLEFRADGPAALLLGCLDAITLEAGRRGLDGTVAACLAVVPNPGEGLARHLWVWSGTVSRDPSVAGEELEEGAGWWYSKARELAVDWRRKYRRSAVCCREDEAEDTDEEAEAG